MSSITSLSDASSFDPSMTVGRILDKTYDDLINTASLFLNQRPTEQNDRLMQAAFRTAYLLTSLKGAYPFDIEKPFATAGREIFNPIQDATRLAQSILSGLSAVPIDKLTEQITSIAHFSPMQHFWVPRISTGNPQIIAVNACSDTSVFIKFRGNFPYASNPSWTPTFTLNGKNYLPMNPRENALVFRVTIPKGTAQLHQFTLLKEGKLTIPWKWGFLPHQWVSSEYKTTFCLLPASPGKITATFTHTNGAIRQEENHALEWGGSCYFDQLIDERISLLFKSYLGEEVEFPPLEGAVDHSNSYLKLSNVRGPLDVKVIDPLDLNGKIGMGALTPLTMTRLDKFIAPYDHSLDQDNTIEYFLDKSFKEVTATLEHIVDKQRLDPTGTLFKSAELTAAVITSLKAVYSDSSFMTFGYGHSIHRSFFFANDMIRFNIFDLRELVSWITTEESLEMQKVLKHITLLQQRHLSTFGVPSISHVTPNLFAASVKVLEDPLANDLTLKIMGCFPYVDYRGCKPTLKLFDRTFAPSTASKTELVFKFVVDSPMIGLLRRDKHTLIKNSELNITWKYAGMPWQWVTSQLHPVFGFLPGYIGKLSVTYTKPDRTVRFQEKLDLTWGESWKLTPEQDEVPMVTYHSFKGEVVELQKEAPHPYVSFSYDEVTQEYKIQATSPKVVNAELAKDVKL